MRTHLPRRARAAVPASALVMLLALTAAAAAATPPYQTVITRANRLGMTVSNYGFFGNNFTSRAPSLEFPLGSGYEHMSRAGLWVGAVAYGDSGTFTGVSTGIVDDAQGTSAAAETEFTPYGEPFVELSRVANSPLFSPAAISDEDWVCSFTDRPARRASGAQTERHVPLGIVVRQRTLGFALPAADAFVVTQFAIVNDGPPLADVYVGFYAQLVSGNKAAQVDWPPRLWYYKTHAEYDASRRLYKERYCARAPYPDGCDVTACPPWAGVKLLGARPGGLASRTVSFNWWSYSPGDTARALDVQRYALLGNGEVDATDTCVPGNNSCSPIMLLSVGPFAQLDPGDTVFVDVALVGGEDEARLLEHADFAQFAYDIDYQLPQPPPSPRLRVEAGHQSVDLYWDDSPEAVVDPSSAAPGGQDFEGYRVYLSQDRQDLHRVAQFDLRDTTGFNTGLEPARLATPRVIDGVTYTYHHRITGLRDGFHYFGAVTSFDLGDSRIESLESGFAQNKFAAIPNAAGAAAGDRVTVYPNPYRVEAGWDRGALVRDHYLWFANLPRHATIRIYTLSGDLVMQKRFDGDTEHGLDARGVYDARQDVDISAPTLSGGAWPWDLITRDGQAAATGLYLWSVEDHDHGSVSRGRFVVVKSDRER
jgi:hypothetical protein